MSYIVKNCPSCKEYNVFGIDTDYCCYDKQDYCKNITDCVIKQVIEKCLAKKLDIYNPSVGNEHYAIANSVLSTQILQLFDIEEVGNE